MTDLKLKRQNDLRDAVIASFGGEHLTALDDLLTDSVRLKELEASVLKKAEMLRKNFWDISDETGPAGELHAAITGLHIVMEGIAKQRDQLRDVTLKAQSSTLDELEIKGREEANLLECRLSRIETLLQLPTLI